MNAYDTLIDALTELANLAEARELGDDAPSLRYRNPTRDRILDAVHAARRAMATAQAEREGTASDRADAHGAKRVADYTSAD